MNEVQKMKELLIEALQTMEAYEAKQTKAASARLRKAVGEVKKNVVAFRSTLVSADLNGY